MRICGAGAKLRVELSCDEPGMARQLDHLYEIIAGAYTAENHSVLFKNILERVVHFITVTMAFVRQFFFICLKGFCSLHDLTRIRTKAHRTTVCRHVLLLNHHVDDILIGLFEFRAVGAGKPAYIPRELNDGILQTEADTKERDVPFSHISYGADFSFNAPLSEARRDQQSVNVFEMGFSPLAFNVFGTNPEEIDLHTVCRPGVNE